MVSLPLIGNAFLKPEMEYNGKFGHTIVWIQIFSLKSRINIYYTDYRLETQTVTHTLPGFQGLKRYIQYISSHPHKTIFYPYNYYKGANFIIFTWIGNQVED